MGSQRDEQNGRDDRGGDFWDRRAERYDRLSWVNNGSLLDWTIDCLSSAVRDPNNVDCLELGPGTGALTARLVNQGWNVHAFEVSPSMANRAREAEPKARIWDGDWREAKPRPVYDLVVARMVLRHDPNPAASIARAMEWLHPRNGVLAIVEGPPPVSDPSHPAVDLYRRAMSVKHGSDRPTIFAWSIVDAMLAAGCAEIGTWERYTDDNSLTEWLEAAQVAPAVKDQVVAMHLTASVAASEAYAMQVIRGDVLMRWRHCVVVGRRRS